MDPNDLTSLYATLAIANILGNCIDDEESEGYYRLQDSSVTMLIECVEYAESGGVYRGMVWIPMCIFSLFSLSKYSFYMPQISTRRVLDLLLKFIRQFNTQVREMNSPEVIDYVCQTFENILSVGSTGEGLTMATAFPSRNSVAEVSGIVESALQRLQSLRIQPEETLVEGYKVDNVAAAIVSCKRVKEMIDVRQHQVTDQ